MKIKEMFKEKILADLYGQTLGDSFGMPAYFHPDQTNKKYDWIEHFLPGPPDHVVHSGLPAGRITDDSEQVFSLATEYIKNKGVTIEATVEAINNWYDRVGGDDSSYVGPSTHHGVKALKQCIDINLTGTMGDTNRAAMRISVLGLLHPNDSLGAIEDAHISCIPTDNTNIAISGVSAVAAAISIAMGKDSTIDAIINSGKMGSEIDRTKGPIWLGPSVTKRIDLAVKIAQKGGELTSILREIYDVVGTSLSIVETVGSAFGILALSQGDVKKTAIYAANLSGDADTVGAITCAIAGTYQGIDGFDVNIVKTLDNDLVFASNQVNKIAQGIEELIKQRLK